MRKNYLLFLFPFLVFFSNSCQEQTKEPNTYDFRENYVGDFKMTVYTAYHRGNVNTVWDTFSYEGTVQLYNPADSLMDLTNNEFMDFFDDPRISIGFAPDTIISPAISSNGSLQGISKDAYLEGGFVTRDSINFKLRFNEPNFWAREFFVVGVRK